MAVQTSTKVISVRVVKLSCLGEGNIKQGLIPLDSTAISNHKFEFGTRYHDIRQDLHYNKILER